MIDLLDIISALPLYTLGRLHYFKSGSILKNIDVDRAFLNRISTVRREIFTCTGQRKERKKANSYTQPVIPAPDLGVSLVSSLTPCGNLVGVT
jgi:hypothetical protein